MPFAFFSVINQLTLHQYFHVQLYKFKFIYAMHSHYTIKITTLYITLITYNAVAFISKYTLQTFVCKVYFSCHKVSSHSSSGSLLMTKSGLDGSRTRVQKPFPCSSTIIVSCLNFPQVIEN